MKLVLVTAVDEFQASVLKLFKKANIENFSCLDIDGYKKEMSLFINSNWFTSDKGSTESCLFFSFTEEENIDVLFGLIKEFNNSLETNNPVKSVVVPIERHI